MKRRHFIGASAAWVLLPAIPNLCRDEPGELASAREYLFVDERFPQAHRTLGRWSAASRPIRVHGDITPVWQNGLNRMTQDYPLRLRGVTSQSFLFCLRILAGETADIDVQARRVDRDLWQWTILTTPKLFTEPRHA